MILTERTTKTNMILLVVALRNLILTKDPAKSQISKTILLAPLHMYVHIYTDGGQSGDRTAKREAAVGCM